MTSWKRTLLWALLNPREAAQLAWDICEMEAEAQSLTLIHRVVLVDRDKREEVEREPKPPRKRDPRWN